MSDPEKDYDDMREFRQVVSEGLVPRLEDSTVSVVIAPYTTDENHQYDIKFAVELGLMILMDKPILTVQHPGTTVSKKLELVSDKIVHADIGTPEGHALLEEAMRDMGLIPDE